MQGGSVEPKLVSYPKKPDIYMAIPYLTHVNAASDQNVGDLIT